MHEELYHMFEIGLEIGHADEMEGGTEGGTTGGKAGAQATA